MSKPAELEEEREFSAQYPGISISVYRTLRERARQKGWIGYEELNQARNLGLDLGTDNGRNLIGEFVGAVSEFEVEKHPPMLSAIVVHQQSPREPGQSFYKWADELHQRKPSESDRALWFRILSECHAYWSQNPWPNEVRGPAEARQVGGCRPRALRRLEAPSPRDGAGRGPSARPPSTSGRRLEANGSADGDAARGRPS